MFPMTRESQHHHPSDLLLAAAVDEAISPRIRRLWDERVAQEKVFVGRQGIFSSRLHRFGYQLAFRSPEAGLDAACHSTPTPSAAWTELQHERATAHVLRATFGRADVDQVAQGHWVFVRCPRDYLTGNLPLPSRPDRLIVEVSENVLVDDEILAGVTRLRAAGFRISLPGFVSRTDQRRLLPFADFVKIDVRDLDVEGRPVVELGRSTGALLIAEFVETGPMLQQSRDLGFDLFQGNLLERGELLDRSRAALVPTGGGHV
ncbi:EAL domain-containing protein [Cellulomonas hominis]